MESYKKQKLTKVKVRGFKSIRDQEVDLRLLNVLIGGNGAGKSNFFDVFSLLEKICQKQLGLYSTLIRETYRKIREVKEEM